MSLCRIPPEYWTPLPSRGDGGLLSDKANCPSACLMRGEECMGFSVDAESGSCTLGTAEVTAGNNNFIPEYIWNGTRVYLRAGLFKQKAAERVKHVVALLNSGVDDQPFENSTQVHYF